MQVTDDKTIEKQARKRFQIERALRLSPRAKVIKLADKIVNLTDFIESPPVDWSLERRQKYVDWSNRVIAGCRGLNSNLEKICDARAMGADARLI
jgi:guanosine-3',5'-bis(diphosphate) 3'-pyrophosphohydrolase